MRDYTIEINGRDVPVEHVPADFFDESGIFGKTDGNKVWLADDLEGLAYWMWLMHELNHLLFTEKDHNQLDLEAQILARTMFDNCMLLDPEKYAKRMGG